MKSTKLLLGLLSSLFLFVGFTKAAEITDPLAGRFVTQSVEQGDMARNCTTCGWADIDR